MRTPWRSLTPMFLALIPACSGSRELEEVPAATAAEIGAALLGSLDADAPTRFLRSLAATSGRDVDHVLDGDLTTGWSPSGDPVDEGISFEAEEPVRATALVVRACDGSAEARWQASLDGAPGPTFTVGPGREQAVELGAEAAGRPLRTVSLRVVSADAPGVCVAEIGLRADRALLAMRPPRSVPGRVEASSSREPAQVWSAAWLVDGRADTAWAEGAVGLGQGERLTLTLEESAEVVALEIWSGDQRSEAARLASARLRSLRVEVEGAAPVTVEIADVAGPQRVELPAPIAASAFAFVLDGAVAGADGGEEVTVAEIRLFDRHGPVSVRTDDASDRAKAVAAAISGSPLARFVDHRWGSVCGVPPRAWKLRGDLGFVRHDGAARWAADGPAVAEVMEGRWVAGAVEGPWASVHLEGARRRADAAWATDDPDRVRVAAGDIRVAFASDLGQEGLRAVLDGWQERRERVGCLTEELGVWADAWDALVARDAVVLQGPDLADLLWREGL